MTDLPKNGEPRQLSEQDMELIRRDTCPDCKAYDGFANGPRGGAGRNIFCLSCGQGFNVTYPRSIVMGERIHKREWRL